MRNQKKQGTVITYHPNGEVKSETNYKNRVRHGAEINWDEDGLNVTEVTWENGLKKEEWRRKGSKEALVTKWYKNGQKRMEGTLSNDKRHGVVTWWDETGRKVTEVNYKDGKKHGLSTYWHGTNMIESVYKIREENYKGGKRHGLAISYHENAQKEKVGYYVLDDRYASVDWDYKGNVIKTQLPTPPRPTTSPAKTNKKTKARQQNMQNHKKQPPVTTYHPNGNKKSEKSYKNNQLHGLHTEWDEHGRKTEETPYKDGKPHGLYTWWWDNGYKRLEINYEYGGIHGLYTWWDKNGTKRRKSNYKTDKKHGMDTHWHKNGLKEREEMWKDGKKHGSNTLWHSNGQKRQEVHYISQKPYSRMDWDEDGNVLLVNYSAPAPSSNTKSEKRQRKSKVTR